jgi:hypothetical protein
MKMKTVEWHKRPRIERLANVMYPHLADAETQRQMAEIARGEGRRSPLEGQADAEKARLKRQSGRR